MLVAIANGEQKLSAKQVVGKYGLGGAQTIVRNKSVLEEKDLIEQKGRQNYLFVDPVFRLWFRQNYL